MPEIGGISDIALGGHYCGGTTMLGKSRKPHPILALALPVLILTAFTFCASSPVAAQERIPDDGSRGARTLVRQDSSRKIDRNAQDRGTDRDRSGSRGGRMGSFGAGLAIGIGGALIEQLAAPHPANNSVQEPQPRKKKNASVESAPGSKDSRKDKHRLSEVPRSGGNNGQSGPPPEGERRFIADEAITEFAPNATPQAIDQIARRYNLTQLESQNFSLIGAKLYRWRIGGRRSPRDVIGRLEHERIVVGVQPNYIFALQEDARSLAVETSGDAAQYVLGKLQIEQAHQVATGKGILVAVIDSEVDAKHPDLDATIAKGFDGLGGEHGPHKHGTAMAGAIASHGKLLGIAPGAKLLVVRAFDDAPEQARGTSFAIYKGLQWAAESGSRVVNMSFSGPEDPDLHRFLASAYDKGMVLVAAAGNAGPRSGPSYPAADPRVIAVTATDANDGVLTMANRGQYISVAAPGVEIIALAPAGTYQITTGTSVAAAHVSGIAALLLEHQPTLKPFDVRSILMTTARPLATDGRSEVGAGLVNAYLAVTKLDSKSASPDDRKVQAKK
jgi:subtilisin family serine protease